MSDNNINEYFDRIFIINLKRRNDRKENMIKKLEIANITNYEFIEAIDGNEEPYYSLYRSRLSNGTFLENQNAFGVLFSALKVLVWSKNKNYNKILILEDDAIFHKDFSNIFNERIKDIPEWKLLYFGTSMEKWRLDERCQIEKNKNFLRAKGTIAGAVGLGIHSSIFDELIYYLRNTTRPWDIGPLKIINTKYQNEVIVFYPYLIICHTEDSNIREGISISNYANECGWQLELYDGF